MSGEPRSTTPSPARQRLEELHAQSLERRRLLERVERHLIAGDFLLAVDDLAATVRMLSSAEERVMQLHAECLAMIEQAGKILQLDASLRPVTVTLDPGTVVLPSVPGTMLPAAKP